MKNYFLQYKPFLIFLFKFLGTYLVLAILYKMYLNQFSGADGFTHLVANQSSGLLSFLDPQSDIRLENEFDYVLFTYRQITKVRIIEGCNALSIIILFASFIVAFSGRLKHTILYILSGSLIIHLFNIGRIALLVMLLHYFPQWQTFLHDILFPLIIYGTVFILWIVWIRKFSLISRNNED